MEVITIRPKNAKEFDNLVHGSLPDDGRLIIATKEHATEGGRPAVVLSFRVEIDGKIHRVQTVNTLRNLVVAVDGLKAAHLLEVDN